LAANAARLVEATLRSLARDGYSQNSECRTARTHAPMIKEGFAATGAPAAASNLASIAHSKALTAVIGLLELVDQRHGEIFE